MVNRCVKLFLVLLLVAAVAVGVSFLPFSLSEKFKKVADAVKSHLRGLTDFGQGEDGKLHLDLSKMDSYTFGKLNVALDKVDNFPKEGFFKFVHKGEKDAPLNVEKFMNGEKELDGVEPALVDYCAGYFKKDLPHLLAVELMLHDNDGTPKTEDKRGKEGGEGKKGGETKGGDEGSKDGNENKEGEGKTSKNNNKLFYVPGQNDKWVKLSEDVDLGTKLEEVLNNYLANNNNGGNQTTNQDNTPPKGGQNGSNNGNAPNGGSGAPVKGGETPAGGNVQPENTQGGKPNGNNQRETNTNTNGLTGKQVPKGPTNGENVNTEEQNGKTGGQPGPQGHGTTPKETLPGKGGNTVLTNGSGTGNNGGPDANHQHGTKGEVEQTQNQGGLLPQNTTPPEQPNELPGHPKSTEQLNEETLQRESAPLSSGLGGNNKAGSPGLNGDTSGNPDLPPKEDGDHKGTQPDQANSQEPGHNQLQEQQQQDGHLNDGRPLGDSVPGSG